MRGRKATVGIKERTMSFYVSNYEVSALHPKCRGKEKIEGVFVQIEHLKENSGIFQPKP